MGWRNDQIRDLVVRTIIGEAGGEGAGRHGRGRACDEEPRRTAEPGATAPSTGSPASSPPLSNSRSGTLAMPARQPCAPSRLTTPLSARRRNRRRRLLRPAPRQHRRRDPLLRAGRHAWRSSAGLGGGAERSPHWRPEFLPPAADRLVGRAVVLQLRFEIRLAVMCTTMPLNGCLAAVAWRP
jgi:hypothetical protein